jgi:hypothetical protein
MIRTFITRAERGLRNEASTLEDTLGFQGALKLVRQWILKADRPHRRRLYRLHDEIARRHWPLGGPSPPTSPEQSA